MKEIMVHAVHPPIPTQTFDYCAYFDGDETGQQGTGPSENAAIIDLLQQEVDRLEDDNFKLAARVCDIEMGDAIRLILPLAKGYAAANPVGSNAQYIRHAENVLEMFGGPSDMTGCDHAIIQAAHLSNKPEVIDGCQCTNMCDAPRTQTVARSQLIVRKGARREGDAGTGL